MAGRLPPATKLSLALRKQLREDYEDHKERLEKELSGILGVPWTIQVNPLELWPYAEESNSSASSYFAATIKGYLEGAIYRFSLHKDSHGDAGVEEVNKIAYAHVLTIDVNESVKKEDAFAYCGVDIKDGKIRLLFARTSWGSNHSQCFDQDRLLTALQAAEQDSSGAAEPALSYLARTSIRQDWDSEYEATLEKLRRIVGNPAITFEPNFEDTYAKLLAESKRPKTPLQANWESYLGRWTVNYFTTLVDLMPGFPDDFENDAMLQEGFNDAVSANKLAFRIVDKLLDSSYNRHCEVQVEDGVLYIQTTVDNWGSNPNEAYSKLLEAM